MSDLISRQGMLARLEEWNTDDPTDKALYNFAWNRIIEQPTIELRCEECEAFNKTRLLVPQPERKKGEWIEDGYYDLPCVCSYCGTEGERKWNFCPHCGAYMRGDDHDL